LVSANANTYTFTVTNASGCTSPSSANIVVNAQPIVRQVRQQLVRLHSQHVQQPQEVFKSLGFNVANTYTFNPGVISISASGLVTANANTYTFTVTNASGCTSPSSANIVVNAQPIVRQVRQQLVRLHSQHVQQPQEVFKSQDTMLQTPMLLIQEF
jgi:hypothetical protein